jgi:hypothetical protein
MNRRSSDVRETLAQRVANTHARQGAPATPAADAGSIHSDGSGADSPPPVKHCWYGGPHGRQAALLLEWRNRAGTSHARIAVALPHPDHGWGLAELWVEAGLLSPT